VTNADYDGVGELVFWVILTAAMLFAVLV